MLNPSLCSKNRKKLQKLSQSLEITCQSTISEAQNANNKINERDELQSMMIQNQSQTTQNEDNNKQQLPGSEVKDDIEIYFNLNREEDYLNEELQQEPEFIVRETPKKNKIRIYLSGITKIECRHCNALFDNSRALGGHTQKVHRTQQL